MRKMITLPGIGGSGDAHWQSIWEAADARFVRFRPANWDQPELDDWVQSLERAVESCTEPPVLVAHSLACLLVAHWAARARSAIAGAFLVSVPDPDGAAFPEAATSFKPAPTSPLPFPSLVIASTNDPYSTLDVARRRAGDWHSEFSVVGALGHINASSGLDDWQQGRALLEAFCAGLAARGTER
ncbi:alpha/beta hydrolase [Bradyrhizobium liaoningense]|uniref:RBBP9/YdeN family alpha/beta hydrolase n=1 Tax=Bradyrhizobium liaoningense TaxID=43992 RepID=UPI001BAA6805|nr:alpha/beta hydrolase [Bradyrhizobium liaoningense]MBR0841972.1 alpha/beta hydrolase [Bradyrhizobium liaoningense]